MSDKIKLTDEVIHHNESKTILYGSKRVRFADGIIEISDTEKTESLQIKAYDR